MFSSPLAQTRSVTASSCAPYALARSRYAGAPGGQRRALSWALCTSPTSSSNATARRSARSVVSVPSPDSSCCTRLVDMLAADASWGWVSSRRWRQSARDRVSGWVMMTSSAGIARARIAPARISTCGDASPSSHLRIVSAVLIPDSRAKSLRLMPARSRARRNSAGANPRRTLRLIRSESLGSSLDTLAPPPYDSDLRVFYKRNIEALSPLVASRSDSGEEACCRSEVTRT